MYFHADMFEIVQTMTIFKSFQRTFDMSFCFFFKNAHGVGNGSGTLHLYTLSSSLSPGQTMATSEQCCQNKNKTSVTTFTSVLKWNHNVIIIIIIILELWYKIKLKCSSSYRWLNYFWFILKRWSFNQDLIMKYLNWSLCCVCLWRGKAFCFLVLLWQPSLDVVCFTWVVLGAEKMLAEALESMKLYM